MSLGHTPGNYNAEGKDMMNSFIWILRVRIKDISHGSDALSLGKIQQTGLPLLGTAMPIERR